MKKYPIDLASLRYDESGQFIHRFLLDFKGTGLDPKTDANFDKLYQEIIKQSPTYDEALGQIIAKAESLFLAERDLGRDRKIITVRRAVFVFEFSDDPAEIVAFTSLKILLDNYIGLEKDNYEAETLGIDNLLADLKGPVYAPYVTTLGIGKHVTNLETEANKFKTIFDNRSNKTVSTVVYNAKALRKNIFGVYGKLVNYVASTAEINDSDFYETTLKAINNGRKYFADLLAKREGVADSQKAKDAANETPSAPSNPI
jgi:hypothetical protein